MNTSQTIPTSDSVITDALVYNMQEQTVDRQAVRAALEAGKSVAFKHTANGQPGNIIPGIEIPQGLALFAIKQVPIPGYSHSKHTIATIIAEEIPVTTQVTSAEKGLGQSRKETFSLSEEEIDEEIKKHTELQVDLNNSLTPPSDYEAYFHPYTQHFPFNPGYVQDAWDHNKGTVQYFQILVTQTYYVYLTLNGAQPQFNIIIVQNGYSQTSANGNICCNDGWERVFLNSCFHQRQVLTGCSNAYASSPTTCLNSSTPIPDTIATSMQLICRAGGKVSYKDFTPQYANSVPSPDWGITLNQDYGSVDWCYYTTNPWNSTQQFFWNFQDWYTRMYNDDNGNLVSINDQCCLVTNFDSVALWNAAAQLGMTSLNVGLGYSSWYYIVGFASTNGSGDGSHEMTEVSPANSPSAVTVDLIYLTGSQKYFKP
ncbi:hypothetical protein [Chitinophaga varians]|uniref:hypothetical protein n=1 Tax=Chitinophaga varians TaxID=2202339 RepID=UPI00165EE19B|nr:hypothetical protein [Chitinophaga varians]MBC9909455.1 hypothetical protein [Chitinophaga varians]